MRRESEGGRRWSLFGVRLSSGCWSYGGEAVLEREMLRGDDCVLEKERSVAEGLKVEGGGGAAVFGLFKYGWRRDSVGL